MKDDLYWFTQEKWKDFLLTSYWNMCVVGGFFAYKWKITKMDEIFYIKMAVRRAELADRPQPLTTLSFASAGRSWYLTLFLAFPVT